MIHGASNKRMSLRALDAFAKPRPDLQQRSVAGGVITILAASVTIVLFVGQVYNYCQGRLTQSLRLAPSKPVPLTPIEGSRPPPRNPKNNNQNNNLNTGQSLLQLHLTFPHLNCNMLDVIHDGASLNSGELARLYGRNAIITRKPTRKEYAIFGMERPATNAIGCTIEGKLRPPLVAGSLAIGLSSHAWAEATEYLVMKMRGDDTHIGSAVHRRLEENENRFNVSHYIHKINFSKMFPYARDKPLENRFHIIENDYAGMAVERISVKLIGTKYGSVFADYSYQASVTTHTVQPQILIASGIPFMPGVVIVYDYMPVAIHQSDGRENILVFLSSLISIVGGVFVTVSLLTGCLVSSASLVAKKID